MCAHPQTGQAADDPLVNVSDNSSSRRCLVLAAAGKTGHERQAIAVAERLALPTHVHDARSPLAADALHDVALVLGAGRQSIAPAGAIAARRGRRPVVAMLQPVVWRPGRFDLVWAPRHDRAVGRLAGAHRSGNRIETLTAPSAVTARQRREGVRRVAALLRPHTGPHVGVLVGGASRAHRFGAIEAADLADRLETFARVHDAALLLTTSRRTGAEASNVLRTRLGERAHLFIDATDADASLLYAGLLERADAFVVTADSVAMLSDAAALGKPIHGWRLPGGKAKFEILYRGLVDHGALHWFDGALVARHYAPLDATDVVARALAELLGLPDVAPQHIVQ